MRDGYFDKLGDGSLSTAEEMKRTALFIPYFWFVMLWPLWLLMLVCALADGIGG